MIGNQNGPRKKGSKGWKGIEARRHIGETLFRVREGMGMTMVRAAELGGVHYKSWGRYERGEVSVPSEVLFRFACETGQPVDMFFPPIAPLEATEKIAA